MRIVFLPDCWCGACIGSSWIEDQEGGMALKCTSCGSENLAGKKFCSMCGERLALSAEVAAARIPSDMMNTPNVRYVRPGPQMIIRSREDLLCGFLGGLAWLLVALGTFIIAVGWLGALSSSYFDNPQSSLRLIGYGILIYGIAAIFFSVRAFEKGAH